MLKLENIVGWLWTYYSPKRYKPRGSTRFDVSLIGANVLVRLLR